MSTKLSKLDWLSHGLDTLAQHGHTALKADSMANHLGVSRGSFYWHFKDIKAFHMELLEQWRGLSTESVIETIDSSVPLAERLGVLLNKAFNADTEVERAVRNWAGVNDSVAEQVKAIDRQREAYIVSLFKLNGFSAKVARSRAKVLYWAYLGRMLSHDLQADSRTQEVEDWMDIFLIKSG